MARGVVIPQVNTLCLGNKKIEQHNRQHCSIYRVSTTNHHPNMAEDAGQYGGGVFGTSCCLDVLDAGASFDVQYKHWMSYGMSAAIYSLPSNKKHHLKLSCKSKCRRQQEFNSPNQNIEIAFNVVGSREMSSFAALDLV